jgi:hypothetical protein
VGRQYYPIVKCYVKNATEERVILKILTHG